MIVPTQVRVLFVNCPRLDTLACAYLLLAQNEIQREFEFSVQHHWIFANRKTHISAWQHFLSICGERRWLFRKWALGRFTAALDLNAAPIFRTELDSNDVSPH